MNLPFKKVIFSFNQNIYGNQHKCTCTLACIIEKSFITHVGQTKKKNKWIFCLS